MSRFRLCKQLWKSRGDELPKTNAVNKKSKQQDLKLNSAKRPPESKQQPKPRDKKNAYERKGSKQRLTELASLLRTEPNITLRGAASP